MIKHLKFSRIENRIPMEYL